MRLWKLLLLLAALAVAAGFGGYRILNALRDRAPSQFALEPRRSESFPRGSDPDLAWNQLRRLLTDLRRTEQALQRPISSVRFVELAGNPTNSVFWTTVKLLNPGFDPMTRFEERTVPADGTVLGFYTLEGQPLRYSVKRDPDRPKWRGLIVHLPEPLPPGESTQIWRRERRVANVQAGQDGVWRFGFGRLSGRDYNLEARGIRLPKGASLVAHDPTYGALLSASGTPMVGWINAQLQGETPNLHVSYRLR